jgi:hypothetical protein
MKKYYKDTKKEITEGDMYFSIEETVLPIVKREDKYYAHIAMSCFDDQSEESDSLMFEHLDNAIRYCFEDDFYTGVSYSDYRMLKTLFITK